MTAKGIVARVVPDSIAAELDLAPGDKIVAIDGNPVKDIIDLSFALADEFIELTVEKQDGELEVYEIEKDYDEDLGIEFESAVFDKVRRCANRCLFCFVDQMPSGLRESLYIKDDDYRLSFLYGNFITLTNLSAKDMERIKKLHLSPLYISVHTTDGELRSRMLGNEKAKDIMLQLRKLADCGIEMHTQIVLCPGWNDGEALERTIADIYSLRENILSLAVVPVGLTSFRQGCPALEPFSPECAGAVIRQVKSWQQRCRRETGSNFVYLADEFYLAGAEPIPEYEEYDGFPQLENGVGLVRSFLAEWRQGDLDAKDYVKPLHLDLVCGLSAAKIFAPLIAELAIANLHIRLVPVENRFFGPKITVSGLLTGKDIIDELTALGGPRDGIILPGVALRKGENVFLDGRTTDDVENSLGIPVRAAYNAVGLRQLLSAWR